MTYCLAVFRSRTQTVEFVEEMRKKGAECVLINTPSEARVGCGVSAKFPRGYLTTAKEIIRIKKLNSISGLYLTTTNGFRTSAIRISF